MSFVIVEVAVVTAHNLIAYTTGITEHNFITTHSKVSAIAD